MQTCFPNQLKIPFIRALREVSPEMELFLGNHGHYIKIFVIKLVYVQSCSFHHFTKKLYLEEYVWKDIPPHFLWKLSPKHYFRETHIESTVLWKRLYDIFFSVPMWFFIVIWVPIYYSYLCTCTYVCLNCVYDLYKLYILNT